MSAPATSLIIRPHLPSGCDGDNLLDCANRVHSGDGDAPVPSKQISSLTPRLSPPAPSGSRAAGWPTVQSSVGSSVGASSGFSPQSLASTLASSDMPVAAAGEGGSPLLLDGTTGKAADGSGTSSTSERSRGHIGAVVIALLIGGLGLGAILRSRAKHGSWSVQLALILAVCPAMASNPHREGTIELS